MNADPDPGGKMKADPFGSGSESTALVSGFVLKFLDGSRFDEYGSKKQ